MIRTIKQVAMYVYDTLGPGHEEAIYRDAIRIEFQATVLGYGDEFYKCSYDLTKDGWTGSSDLYVWNEEYSTYECQ